MAGEMAAYQALVQAQRQMRRALERRRNRVAERIGGHSRNGVPSENAEAMACPTCRRGYELGSVCPECDEPLLCASFVATAGEEPDDDAWDDAMDALRRDRMRRAARTGALGASLFLGLAVVAPVPVSGTLGIPITAGPMVTIAAAIALFTGWWVVRISRGAWDRH